MSRPYDKRNGYSAIGRRSSGRQSTLPSCIRATSPQMTSSPTSSASDAVVNPLGDYHWEDSEDSIHELDESGFSSREPSTLGEVTGQTISAPSTPLPHGMMRKKPPPKPPRMRGCGSTSTMVKNSTLKAPPSIITNGTDTLKSSIADVTNTLDNSFLKTPDIFKGRSTHVPATPKEKVQSVLSQAKEFLAYEIEPEEILHIMRERLVVDSRAEMEIRKCTTRFTMSEMLIDAVTSKGHRAFVVFCESLRSTKKQGYIVDLLETLDSLVELITGLNSKETMLGTADSKSKSQTLPVERDDLSYDKICPDCATNNNFPTDDIFDDGGTFDIEILYMDTNSGQTNPVKDVAILKRRKRPRSMGGPEDSWFIRDDADKYIPVLSLSVYNQCLINGGGIDMLCNLLEKYSCIRDMSIVKNHIDAKGMTRLGQALGKNRGLIELDIRLNSIGDGGAEHLAQGIRRHPTLKVLNVTSTSLSGHGCSMLIQGSAKNQTLAEVDIGFNDLDEESGCVSIAEALASNCGVRKLRMRATGLHQDGATKILKALKRNSRLAFLDISGNKLGNESLSTLGEVLLCNRTVKEINLENCYISQEGCSYLARGLRTNTTLKYLDLSMNPLKDDGIQALADGLKYNQVLDTLCLNMCCIGNQGFTKLLESLRFNSTMTTLKLCYNNIGHDDPKSNPSTPTAAHRPFMELPVPTVDELYEKLCQILQTNKDLKVLLWGNKFEDTQYDDSKVFFHESDMT